jgi:hypothetical protein
MHGQSEQLLYRAEWHKGRKDRQFRTPDHEEAAESDRKTAARFCLSVRTERMGGARQNRRWSQAHSTASQAMPRVPSKPPPPSQAPPLVIECALSSTNGTGSPPARQIIAIINNNNAAKHLDALCFVPHCTRPGRGSCTVHQLRLSDTLGSPRLTVRPLVFCCRQVALHCIARFQHPEWTPITDDCYMFLFDEIRIT